MAFKQHKHYFVVGQHSALPFASLRSKNGVRSGPAIPVFIKTWPPKGKNTQRLRVASVLKLVKQAWACFTQTQPKPLPISSNFDWEATWYPFFLHFPSLLQCTVLTLLSASYITYDTFVIRFMHTSCHLANLILLRNIKKKKSESKRMNESVKGNAKQALS